MVHGVGEAMWWSLHQSGSHFLALEMGVHSVAFLLTGIC